MAMTFLSPYDRILYHELSEEHALARRELREFYNEYQGYASDAEKIKIVPLYKGRLTYKQVSDRRKDPTPNLNEAVFRDLVIDYEAWINTHFNDEKPVREFKRLFRLLKLSDPQERLEKWNELKPQVLDVLTHKKPLLLKFLSDSTLEKAWGTILDENPRIRYKYGGGLLFYAALGSIAVKEGEIMLSMFIFLLCIVPIFRIYAMDKDTRSKKYLEELYE